MLIIFEGPDGCGKTTLATMLTETLPEAKYYASPGREPGTLGEHIYRLHHGVFGDLEICPDSLQMLHVTSHINALRTRILPWLKAGLTVIMDRFYWSTLVYGLEYGASPWLLEQIVDLERAVWGDWLEHALLFYINRRTPIIKHDDPKAQAKWQNIARNYEMLFATRDTNLIPNRYKIDNNGMLDDAFQQIVSLSQHYTLYELPRL